MRSDFVSVEKRGRVAVVRFDRGDKANALSAEVMAALTDVARAFEDDVETSAVVLTGQAGLFTLGRDLKDPALAGTRRLPLAERRHALQRGKRLGQAWEDMEPMTIAAVEGWCVGGGVALAAACDLRVAGEGALFYTPEIERGMNMSWGTVPRLVNLMGPARTKRLLVVAERLSARRALEWGLVDQVAPAGRALEAALETAERIAALPPVQVRMLKGAITAAATALNRLAAHMDFDQFALAEASDDFEEGVRAFLEKRKPLYRGR